MLIGQIQMGMGDNPGALETFQELRRLTPPNNARAVAATELRVGAVLMRLERFADALGHLQAAAGSTDTVSRAYAGVYMAEMLWRTGAIRDAVVLLSDGKAPDEASGVARVRATSIRAEIAVALGRPSQALALIRTVPPGLAERDPDTALQFRCTLVRALAASGELKRARVLCSEPDPVPASARATPQKLLACAEADLASHDADAAALRASDAQRRFSQLDQPESAWQACAIAALAMRANAAIQKSEECEQIRSHLLKRWGQELYNRYLTRPDVRATIDRLRRLQH